MFKRLGKYLLVTVLACTSVFAIAGCGKTEEEEQQHILTREELSVIYKEVAVETWESIGVDNPTTPRAETFAYIVDKKRETTDASAISNIKMNANSMAGLIYMIGLLYANENFVITNDIAKFDADITMQNQTFSQSFVLKTSLDTANNKLYLKSLVEVNGSVQYSNLEINYDFSTKTLKSYRFITNVGSSGTYIDMGLTEDNKYMWYDTTSTTDEFAIAVETEKTELTQLAGNITKITTKFSSEVQTYMNIIQRVIDEMN